MTSFKKLILWILIITTPNLLASPQDVSYRSKTSSIPKAAVAWHPPTTFDGWIHFIEAIESTDLLSQFSSSDFKKIESYLHFFRQVGSLSPEDIDCLPVNFISQLSRLEKFPSDYPNFQCNKISKAWKNTKKFVHKHKKEILIGASIVVATVGVIAVVNHYKNHQSAVISQNAAVCDPLEEPEDLPISLETSNIDHLEPEETCFIGEKMLEQVPLFKKEMLEDVFEEVHEVCFKEKVREFTAHVAHVVLNETSTLTKVLPEFCEEVKSLGSPALQLVDGFEINPMENYNNLVLQGHQFIDWLFSTDQAEIFLENCSRREHLTLGLLPPPGAILTTISDVTKFLEAGKVIDRSGFTKAGRALMKHGNRPGSVFPKPKGNPNQINAHGQEILESILNHPDIIVYEKSHLSFGKVIDFVIPEKGGVRYSIEGKLIGFLQPKVKK